VVLQELKNKQEEESDLDTQKKIQKFAQMLKTLNEYKSKYKSTRDRVEKAKIHR
jgi:Na+-transporting NADH:ubiquinone oxidoreductase subunit NqrC